MPAPYAPRDYWEQRLAADPSLRATGHWCYSPGYNTWLYRAKRRALHRALRGVRAPFAALDVGSGHGWVVGELLHRGATVTGCDIAAGAVAALQTAFPASRFIQVDVGAEPLPLSDATVDVVTMLDVAYHLTDDAAWQRAVTELSRVTRPGGRLVVSDGFGATTTNPAPHVRFRSLGDWRRVATSAGLDEDALFPYFRWLSRDPAARPRLPDRIRGPVEYVLDRVVPRSPHMRCAVFVRR